MEDLFGEQVGTVRGRLTMLAATAAARTPATLSLLRTLAQGHPVTELYCSGELVARLLWSSASATCEFLGTNGVVRDRCAVVASTAGALELYTLRPVMELKACHVAACFLFVLFFRGDPGIPSLLSLCFAEDPRARSWLEMAKTWAVHVLSGAPVPILDDDDLEAAGLEDQPLSVGPAAHCAVSEEGIAEFEEGLRAMDCARHVVGLHSVFAFAHRFSSPEETDNVEDAIMFAACFFRGCPGMTDAKLRMLLRLLDLPVGE